MSTEGILAAIEAAMGALDRVGLDSVLIGGAAMPAWGRIRATQDADLLVGLSSPAESGKQAVTSCVSALREAGFAHMERADRRQLEEKLILHFWFPLRSQGISIRLDVIFVPENESSEILKRAGLRKIDGLEVRVASCEDLILLKLSTGRPVDIADIKELISINRDELDWNYLEGQATLRNLVKELQEAREEPGNQ